MSFFRPVAAPLLFLAGIVPAHATAVFAVGSGAGCGYATIQQAVDAERTYAGANDLIHVSRTLTYTAQAVYVHDQNVAIVGGYDDCNDTTPSGTTTISGSGGAAASVITVRGNTNLRLSYVTITQGDKSSSGVGGGIDFQGYGTLKLDNARILSNSAGYGGGMNVNGTNNATGATVDVGTETFISSNTAAVSGGGIRIEGKTVLHVLAPQTFIANNSADGGFGGGIQVLSPAMAELGSPGYQGLGLLYGNSAKYGGGLAVNGIAAGSTAYARLFTVDALHPVTIEGNAASTYGGGVFVQGYDSGSGEAMLCGFDYRITGNTAPEGSAIYGANGITSVLLGRYNATACDITTAVSAFGAKTCTSDRCNLIDANVAQNISGMATAGAAIALQGAAFLVDRVRVHGNHGAHALHLFTGGDADAYIRNCLFDGNVLTSDLARGETQTEIQLRYCTLVGNQLGSGVVLRSAGGLRVTGSILNQAETSLVYTGGNPNDYLTLDYILANDTASLAQGTHIYHDDPQFVDAAGGDYRLLPTSPAIDRAPAEPQGHDNRDLDNRPRDQDMLATPNGDGVRDLGAYERQARYCGATDTIFCSNFQYD